ncbi:MAG: apolipoprotein N-acyltransferase, partial [Roseovarius sp.]|nr:apolipoprotein N-acyltransferase [Roseovarius sp.]
MAKLSGLPDRALRRLAGLSRLRRWLIVLVIGALAALGQAPVGFWPATCAMFALLFGLFLTTTTWRQAAWLGWVFGTGYFLLALSWIVEPFLVDVARHGWMAPFALIGLAAGLALFFAAGLALGRVAGGGAAGFIGGLGLLEGARGYVFTGFPWAQPGHVLIDTGLLHWASYLGSLGLTALVLGGAAALWHAVSGGRAAAAVLLVLGMLWPLGT